MHFNSSQNSSTFVKSDTVFVCAYAPELTWNLNDRTFPWILLSITFVASPATVALNIVVVTAIMKMKELQTNSNLLLCSLAIADLLVGTVNMPLSVAICFLMVKQVWSQRICLLDILNVYSMYCFSMSSLFHLTVISWERYVAVVKWIEYKTIVSRRLIEILKAVVWLAALCLTIPALLMEILGLAEKISQTLYIIWCVVGTIAIVTIVYFYAMVCVGFRRRKVSEIRRVTDLLKVKLESKLAKTSAILTGSLCLSFFPAIAMFMVGEAFPILRSSSAFLLWELLMQLNSLANPLLYCYRNTRVRNGVKKLFRRNALPAQQEINNVRFVKPNLKGSYALKENSPEFQSTCKPTRFPRSASCELAVVTAHDGHLERHLMTFTRCMSGSALEKKSGGNFVEHRPNSFKSMTTTASVEVVVFGKKRKLERPKQENKPCNSSKVRSKSCDASVNPIRFSKQLPDKDYRRFSGAKKRHSSP